MYHSYFLKCIDAKILSPKRDGINPRSRSTLNFWRPPSTLRSLTLAFRTNLVRQRLTIRSKNISVQALTRPGSWNMTHCYRYYSRTLLSRTTKIQGICPGQRGIRDSGGFGVKKFEDQRYSHGTARGPGQRVLGQRAATVHPIALQLHLRSIAPTLDSPDPGPRSSTSKPHRTYHDLTRPKFSCWEMAASFRGCGLE